MYRNCSVKAACSYVHYPTDTCFIVDILNLVEMRRERVSGSFKSCYLLVGRLDGVTVAFLIRIFITTLEERITLLPTGRLIWALILLRLSGMDVRSEERLFSSFFPF